jgi:hypothetical protein
MSSTAFVSMFCKMLRERVCSVPATCKHVCVCVGPNCLYVGGGWDVGPCDAVH